MKRPIYILLYIFLLSLCSFLASATKVQFTPSAVNMSDSYFYDAAPDTNKGADTGSQMGNPGTIMRTIWNFSYICDQLPGVLYNNITLQLYADAWESTNQPTAYDMNCSWQEMTITWNNCGTGGCEACYNTTSMLTSRHPNIIESPTAYYNLSFNAGWFQAECAKPSEAWGTFIKGTETAGHNLQFYTSDVALDGKKPIIFIDYTEGGAVYPNVTFLNQTPADINSLNVILERLNITYNITKGTNEINESRISLYSKVNNSIMNSLAAVNGSYINSGYIRNNFSSNYSGIFNWLYTENDVYPYVSSLNLSFFYDNAHIARTLASTTTLKYTLYNVTSASSGFYEIMANSTEPASALNVYYCNSSYLSGKPSLSSNCYLFGQVSGTKSFNHTHNAYSKHQVLPFFLTSGKIGSVYVTPKSYFIAETAASLGTWQSWEIPNISRADTYQLSTDNGVTYTNISGTLDAHLHQYNRSEQFCYFAEVCDTSNLCTNTSIRCDAVDFMSIPPTSPIILRPNSSDVFNTDTNITFINGSAMAGNYITYSNISLLNATTLEFILTIESSTSLNSISYSSGSVKTGEYIVRVQQCDNASLCSYGYSSPFWIDNNVPTIVGIYPRDDNTTSIPNLNYFNLSIMFYDSRDLYSYSVNISSPLDVIMFNKTALISGTEYNLSAYVSTLGWANDTVYEITARVCDSHTAQDTALATDIEKNPDSLKFVFGDTWINIRSTTGDEFTTSYKKLTDRYTFDFTYSKSSDIKTYILTSNKPLSYRQDSGYKGHFVVDNYWIDFEQPGYVSVNQFLENQYEITITSKGDNIKFSSIGELNCETYYYTFTMVSAVSSVYDSASISTSNWFNNDLLDLKTTSGVLLMFFFFFIWFCFIIITEWSRIPIIGMLAAIYGFFLGFLFYTTVSAVLGVTFIVISVLYILRCILLVR